MSPLQLVRPAGLAAANLVLATLAAAAPADPLARPPAPARANLVYHVVAGRALTLDLFLPAAGAGAPSFPVVVCLHGGAWEKGEKRNQWPLARELAARGYAAAVVEYRLSGEAPCPAAIVDARAAVRWLRREAAALGLDPARLYATGHSAGGHLAALLATSADVAFGDTGEPPRIRAAVALAAHTDLRIPHIGRQSALPEQAFWVKFLSGTQAENPAAYALASPHEHVTPASAPLLLVAGETDHESTRGREILATYADLGLPGELTVIAGAPHNFMNNSAWRAEAAEHAVTFFNRFPARP
jgi:acetyl esterase/lipase